MLVVVEYFLYDVVGQRRNWEDGGEGRKLRSGEGGPIYRAPQEGVRAADQPLPKGGTLGSTACSVSASSVRFVRPGGVMPGQ